MVLIDYGIDTNVTLRKINFQRLQALPANKVKTRRYSETIKFGLISLHIGISEFLNKNSKLSNLPVFLFTTSQYSEVSPLYSRTLRNHRGDTKLSQTRCRVSIPDSRLC